MNAHLKAALVTITLFAALYVLFVAIVNWPLVAFWIVTPCAFLIVGYVVYTFVLAFIEGDL